MNALVESSGGLAVVDGGGVDVLPLEVAGLMSRDGDAVAAGYARLDAKARALGSPLAAPFMTLSFMALLVIPALKLSDRSDPMAEILAKKIIEIAQTGIRDSAQLGRLALAEIGQPRSE